MNLSCVHRDGLGYASRTDDSFTDELIWMLTLLYEL